jgi:hypothetical protein
VEAERKRERDREGAPGAAWSSAAAWHRRARAERCRATVEDDGVGATRVDVANRWAVARRGARSSAAGCGAVRRSAQR